MKQIGITCDITIVCRNQSVTTIALAGVGTSKGAYMLIFQGDVPWRRSWTPQKQDLRYRAEKVPRKIGKRSYCVAVYVEQL